MKKTFLASAMFLYMVSGGSAGGFDLDSVSLSDLQGSDNGAVSIVPFKAIPPPSKNTASAEVLKKYEQIADASPGTKPRLEENELLSLFRAAVTNKVARLSALGKYDPSGVIGFCFGRAMTVHLLARKMGVPNDSIKKLFLVGDMRSGAEPEWRFHVTTLVKGPRNGWVAVDPIFEKPLPMLDWIKRVRGTWDKNGKAKLYFADPSAILSDLRIVPSPGEEKQEHLIEVSFDPAGKAGFVAKPELGPLAWSLSEDAEVAYFAQVLRDTPTVFDFLGITINGKTIPYNNYFVDLLADLSAPGVKLAGTESLALEALSAPDTPGDKENLYSMKLETLLGKGR
ncbi:MAG: hypothetical protein NTX59_00710 [Elusimicrobia bacterium]|nr:hypothetical protein [Elusimicrobiota bacterium]